MIEVLKFTFDSPLHYFGLLFPFIVLCAAISDLGGKPND